MAEPLPPIQPLPASEPIVTGDGRAQLVFTLFLIAVLDRLNAVEARLAALEP